MSENGMLGKTEYRMGKPRTITDKPLKQGKANAPLELLGKLHKADDTETRRVLVREAMSELFYMFGETLRPWQPWRTYEQNMEDVTVTKQIKRIIKGATS